MNTSTYYLANKAKFLKGHDKVISFGRKEMIEKFGQSLAQEITDQARAEFEALLPKMPYIGGDENSLTDTLVQVSSMLCLYRAMKSHGYSAAEAGELSRTMGQNFVNSHPRFLRFLIGKLYMSNFWRKRMRKKAAISQVRQHPGNFVFEIVENEKGFDWGVNYIECAIVKFFKQQGADEFTPYMCEIDNLMFPGMGIKLIRNGTIAQGCTHCDFRYQKGSV